MLNATQISKFKEELRNLNYMLECRIVEKFTILPHDRIYFGTTERNVALSLLYRILIDKVAKPCGSEPNESIDNCEAFVNAKLDILSGIDRLIEEKNEKGAIECIYRLDINAQEDINVVNIGKYININPNVTTSNVCALLTYKEKMLCSLYYHYTSENNGTFIYAKSIWNACQKLSEIFNCELLFSEQFDKLTLTEYQVILQNLCNTISSDIYRSHKSGPNKISNATFQHILMLLVDYEEFEFAFECPIWEQIMKLIYSSYVKEYNVNESILILYQYLHH